MFDPKLPGSWLVDLSHVDLSKVKVDKDERVELDQLDASRRLRSWTIDKESAGAWTRTGAKVNHYGADGDSPRWITENTGTGTLTRNVASASTTGLAATTGASGEVVLQLSNLHGDIALALPLDSADAPVALDNDEYSNPRTGDTAVRYGWTGAHLRSKETLSGVLLMGMRLYNPQTGRFLSADLMNGGSCNAYDYACADPQNMEDLDGTRLKERVQSKCRQDVCIRIRRICDSKWRCSLNWDFHFRKSWARAWIHAGFKWYIHIRGQYVKSGVYSHGERGSYKFHGAWYLNNDSKGRGWYKCYIWTCRLDPGDSVMFSAWGTATRGGRRYAWSVGQNFGGGGRYS